MQFHNKENVSPYPLAIDRNIKDPPLASNCVWYKPIASLERKKDIPNTGHTNTNLPVALVKHS